jgi:hypothetical protein
MVGLGTAAYLRTQSILRQESLTQMSFALRNQINALEDWFAEKESIVLALSQDPALLSELGELAQDSEDNEAVEITQQHLLDLLRSDLESGIDDLFIIETTSAAILSSTSDDHIHENLILSIETEAGFTTTIPLTNQNLFSPGNATFLVVAGLPQPGNIVIAAVISENEIIELLETLGTFWPIVDNQGTTKGRTLLVLTPDEVIQSSPGTNSYQFTSESAHPVFSSADSFEPRSTSFQLVGRSRNRSCRRTTPV